MSELSKEQIERILKFLADDIQSGRDFVMEQAPLVVQEYLTWVTWYHGIWVVCCLIAVAVVAPLGTHALKRFIAEANSHNEGSAEKLEAEGAATISGFVVIVAVALGGGFGCYNAICLIKVLVAPRIVILEYLSKLAG